MSEKQPKNHLLDFAPDLFSARSHEDLMEKLRARAERFYPEASLEEIVQLTRLVESLFEARRLLPKQGAHQIIDDRSLRLRCGDKLSAYRFFSLSWNKASCFRKKRFSAAKAVRVRKPAAQKLTQSETRISNATLSFRSCRKKATATTSSPATR